MISYQITAQLYACVQGCERKGNQSTDSEGQGHFSLTPTVLSLSFAIFREGVGREPRDGAVSSRGCLSGSPAPLPRPGSHCRGKELGQAWGGAAQRHHTQPLKGHLKFITKAVTRGQEYSDKGWRAC